MAIRTETAITSTIPLYYVLASLVAFFRRPAKSPDKDSTVTIPDAAPSSPRFRKSLLSASALTIIISVVESILEGVQIGGLSKDVDDELFADLLFLVTCIILFLGLLHSNCDVRYPEVGSWILSILVRAMYTFPCRYFQCNQASWNLVCISISAQIIGILLTILIGLMQTCLRSRKWHDQSPESQPLLGEQNESFPIKKDDAKEEQKEDETEDEKARKQIRERPFRQYVMSFKIFTPFVWPVTTRQKLYFGGMCACSVAARVINVLQPLSLGAVINGLAHSYVPWKQICVFVLLNLLASSIGVSLIDAYFNLKLSTEQSMSLNRAAYDHIMNLSADFQDSKSSGNVWQALEQSHSVVSLFHDIAFQVTPAVIDLVAGFVVLWSVFGGYMGLLLTTTIVSFLWLTVNALAPKTELHRKYQDAFIAEYCQLVDSSSNWHTSTHNGQIPREKAQYGTKAQAFADSQLSLAYYSFSTRSVRYLVHMLAFFFACSLAATQIARNEQKAGAFVVLTSYWAQLSWPLSQIVEQINRTLEKLIDTERLLVLFERKPAIQDLPEAKQYVHLGGAVEFENVYFSYDGKRNAAEGITFRAVAGGKTALVGETGAGKSSALKLLFRLYDPEKGRILLDGQDLKGLILDSFRKHIGVVPQDPALFDTTILDNVRYPDLSLSEAEVQAACKAVALHDKIMTFNNGYMEKVGERGCRLSGGELQRLAIARAILKKPDILLLDEATSSVDSVTEAKIQASLDELCKGKTTFVIAHRLSTILKADQILVIESGKIVESGTHSELLQKKGTYHKLWNTQLKLQSEVEREAKSAAKKEELTLVDDLRESQEQSTELIKVTSEGEVEDKKARDASDEPKEGKTEAKKARGRQTVKDRINSINRRLSSSRSPRRNTNNDSGEASTRSPTRSPLKASAPEFVPSSHDNGQGDGVAELGSGVTLRSRRSKQANKGTARSRRARSEPAARDGDSETDENTSTEDENDRARFSRIPKRSR